LKIKAVKNEGTEAKGKFKSAIKIASVNNIATIFFVLT